MVSRVPTPPAVSHAAFQAQLDTRALELSTRALATAELATDGIGALKDEMQTMSARNDQQHADNKATMEAGFQLLHSRISTEKETRQSLMVKVLVALVVGLFGFCVYLLANDSPFVRRQEAATVTIQQGNTR
jgi:hypothetical protein